MEISTPTREKEGDTKEGSREKRWRKNRNREDGKRRNEGKGRL